MQLSLSAKTKTVNRVPAPLVGQAPIVGHKDFDEISEYKPYLFFGLGRGKIFVTTNSFHFAIF